MLVDIKVLLYLLLLSLLLFWLFLSQLYKQGQKNQKTNTAHASCWCDEPGDWPQKESKDLGIEFGYIDALIDDLINFLHRKELDFKNIFALFCDIFATYCILYP